MRAGITFSGRNSQVCIVAISIMCLSCPAFAIEPIGTIGQPVPEHHTFLPDGNILRAVLSHIQIIDTDTGAVIDEFGDRTDISDVVFSPTAAHLAILNYATDSRITTTHGKCLNSVASQDSLLDLIQTVHFYWQFPEPERLKYGNSCQTVPSL